MEDGLVRLFYQFQTYYKMEVLILVVMEDGLVHM